MWAFIQKAGEGAAGFSSGVFLLVDTAKEKNCPMPMVLVFFLNYELFLLCGGGERESPQVYAKQSSAYNVPSDPLFQI